MDENRFAICAQSGPKGMISQGLDIKMPSSNPPACWLVLLDLGLYIYVLLWTAGVVHIHLFFVHQPHNLLDQLAILEDVDMAILHQHNMRAVNGTGTDIRVHFAMWGAHGSLPHWQRTGSLREPSNGPLPVPLNIMSSKEIIATRRDEWFEWACVPPADLFRIAFNMNEWEVDTAHTSPQHLEAGGWVAMVILPFRILCLHCFLLLQRVKWRLFSESLILKCAKML